MIIDFDMANMAFLWVCQSEIDKLYQCLLSRNNFCLYRFSSWFLSLGNNLSGYFLNILQGNKFSILMFSGKYRHFFELKNGIDRLLMGCLKVSYPLCYEYQVI